MQQPEIRGGLDRRGNLGLQHLAPKVADESALGELHAELSTRPYAEIEFEPEAPGGGPSQHVMLAIPSGIRLEPIARVQS